MKAPKNLTLDDFSTQLHRARQEDGSCGRKHFQAGVMAVLGKIQSYENRNKRKTVETFDIFD